MSFACAIAPLDQSATQLGWSVGTFARSPCPVFGVCTTRQEGLQFLADAGTPVIAPFPGRWAAGELTLGFEVPRAIALPPARVRINGLSNVRAAGYVERGDLLGRVGARPRPSVNFELVGGNIIALFRDLGLDVVGAERPSLRGYGLTPMLGGRLLARTGGPADCARSGLAGLERAFLATAVPSGYVEPDQGAYSRFGPSRLTNQNVSVPGAAGNSSGAIALVAVAAVAGVAYAASKR
jgi:hypothetical protein